MTSELAEIWSETQSQIEGYVAKLGDLENEVTKGHTVETINKEKLGDLQDENTKLKDVLTKTVIANITFSGIRYVKI